MNFAHNKPFIDLSCGTGGLSLGLMEVGFVPILAVDTDETCVGAYNRNIARVAISTKLSKVSGRKISEHLDIRPGAFPLVVGTCPFKAGQFQYLYHFFRVVREITPHAFAVVTTRDFLSTENLTIWKWRFRQRRVFSDYLWLYVPFQYPTLGIPVDREHVLVLGLHRRMAISGSCPTEIDFTMPYGPPPSWDNLLGGLTKPPPENMPCPRYSGHASEWQVPSKRRGFQGIAKVSKTLQHPRQNRTVTRREICRLLGLPDWYEIPEWFPKEKLLETLHPLVGSYIGAWALRVDHIYNWSRRKAERMNITPLRPYEFQESRGVVSRGRTRLCFAKKARGGLASSTRRAGYAGSLSTSKSRGDHAPNLWNFDELPDSFRKRRDREDYGDGGDLGI